MGMSAWQARFLGLTARKTNVEYEGQQINQQRTTLSNESSNYYSQLASMSVPTPPSSADYTKLTYTFNNGNEKNTVTSLIARQDGLYMLNYVQEIPQDSMVVQGTSVISRINQGTEEEDPKYQYFLGADELAEYETELPPPVELTIDYVNKNEKSVRDYFKKSIPVDVVNKMTNKEMLNKLILEQKYKALAQEKYSQDHWLVRYQQSSATGVYEPVLFSKTELENADYNEKTTMSLTGIKNYVFGEDTETQEMKNVYSRVEQDTSGRFIALIIYHNEADAQANENGTRYNLTTITESDEAGYNDAMNQYYYDKAQYDQKIQEVNSKIEIIQVQDKNLELKLKQLDTEENAIQTEMDAVKKVISKNVESSFKTFNA